MTRRRNNLLDPKVITTAIGTIGVIIIGYWQYRRPQNSDTNVANQTGIANQASPPIVLVPNKVFKYRGRVRDFDGKASIPDAKVTLQREQGGKLPASQDTYSDGIFSFPVDDKDEDVSVQIEAKGYVTQRYLVTPSANSQPPNFDLKKIHKITVDGQPRPTAPAAATTVRPTTFPEPKRTPSIVGTFQDGIGDSVTFRADGTYTQSGLINKSGTYKVNGDTVTMSNDTFKMEIGDKDHFVFGIVPYKRVP